MGSWCAYRCSCRVVALGMGVMMQKGDLIGYVRWDGRGSLRAVGLGWAHLVVWLWPIDRLIFPFLL